MDNAKHTINFKKLAEVVRDKRLKPMQKTLLVDLLLYAGASGEAFPSQQTLANDLGCSTRQIRYSLDMLCATSLVERKRRGFAKSNAYFFNEELYFHNGRGNRNTSSSHLGNKVPDNSGTPVPPNVTQLNSSSKVLKKIKRKYGSIEDISDTDIREISFQYKVPEGLVRLQLEALRNYCSSKGTRYKDYKAALRNFVLREAKSIIERRALHGNKRGIDATGI